jgi:glutaredoxin
VRTHRQLVVYQSILQVLHEPGCPFCKFLKEYQAGKLQSRSGSETHRVCNFHAWGLAAVQDAPAAAQVFIDILGESEPLNGTDVCDICNEIKAEEDLRIRELATCLHRAAVADWLRREAILCIPHASKLRRQVPLILASRIDAVVQNCRRQLKDELNQLRNEPGNDRSGSGALGRAAEFLVSQRGLRA